MVKHSIRPGITRLKTPDTPTFAVARRTGLLVPAVQCASPNQDDRPTGTEPSLVVIHGTSLPPGEYGGPHIQALFTNTLDPSGHPYFREIDGLAVSSHLLVRRDGEVVQFVPFDRRAWHAGASSFRGRATCNDYSVGIELEGSDDDPYTDRQYRVLAAVLRALFVAYPGIDVRRIAGHCDVSPGRKTDPGPAFDWLRLYDELKVRSGEPGNA